jgi:omega-6 fatty acid desaturase (delta-12 desaturase)
VRPLAALHWERGFLHEATAMSTVSTSAGLDDARRWRDVMAPYASPRPGRTALDIATSFVPFVIGWVAMYQLLDVSYWLVLALSIPTAGFLLRTFILFHDCTHGSLFGSSRANLWFGRLFGLTVFQPFSNWRHHHAVHHGSAGDLDRRGTGDVMTWTVEEYRSKPFRSRLGYRLFRHPLVMFGIGPIWSLVIGPRIWAGSTRTRLRNSILLTNLAVLVLVGGLCMWLGPLEVLLIQAPLVIVAGTAGVWLFYVQHQFEDAYWENSETWSYSEAALRGSSYLRLPQPLQFFTGNIGLHHVHHLSARVPNYNLQRAHDEVEVFSQVPVLGIRDGLHSMRLKLWDSERGRLVTFAEARQTTRPSPAGRLAQGGRAA